MLLTLIIGIIKSNGNFSQFSKVYIKQVECTNDDNNADKRNDTSTTLQTQPPQPLDQLVKNMTNQEKFYDRITHPDIHLCENSHILKGENAKEPDVKICLDRIKANCTVISIGIAYNFIFDDFMLGQGCRVWSFDPSMKPGNYKRGPNHEFRHIGIGSTNGTHQGKSTLYGGKQKYEIVTLEKMFEMMDVTQVDMVRMDVEGAEWDVLEHLDYSKIGQLLLEIHVMYGGKPFTKQVEAFNKIPNSLKLFHAERNRWDPGLVDINKLLVMTKVAELGFLNTQF